MAMVKAEIEMMAQEAEARNFFRTWSLTVPLILFSVIAVALGVGLSLNPKEIPSALIGKSVPVFDLSPVQGRTQGFSDADLRGEVSLLNVFASWCTACRAEHPLFMELARSKAAPLYGLNYKDRADDAAAWLDQLGDPYSRTGADLNGRVGIDFGVYGVPETFVIGSDGTIAYKHIGPLTPQILNEVILPLVARLRKQG